MSWCQGPACRFRDKPFKYQIPVRALLTFALSPVQVMGDLLKVNRNLDVQIPLRNLKRLYNKPSMLGLSPLCSVTQRREMLHSEWPGLHQCRK